MQKLVLLFSLMVLPLLSAAQETSIPEIEAHFSAIIVTDIDASIAWYETMLGFKILNRREFAEASFKQANLKRGSALMELIELDTSLEPKKVIADYNPKTRLTGLFKIGFLVSDFDQLIQHLKNHNAAFHGSIVNDALSGKRMVIIKDSEDNRIQIFED